MWLSSCIIYCRETELHAPKLPDLKKQTLVYHHFCRSGIQAWFSQTQSSCEGTSLVVQWLRIRLTVQGTQVQSLVWEDRTCCGATKPVPQESQCSARKTPLMPQRSCVPQLRPDKAKEIHIKKKVSHEAVIKLLTRALFSSEGTSGRFTSELSLNGYWI